MTDNRIYVCVCVCVCVWREEGGGSVQNCFAMPGFHEEKCLEWKYLEIAQPKALCDILEGVAHSLC